MSDKTQRGDDMNMQDKTNIIVQHDSPIPGHLAVDGVFSVVAHSEIDFREMPHDIPPDKVEALAEAQATDDVVRHIRKAVFGDMIAAINAGNDEIHEWIRCNAHLPTFKAEVALKVAAFTEGLIELTK